MSNYNVLTMPWIQVEMSNGSIKELGIKDVLLKAHSIKQVTEPSPVIEYGIQRLLVVLLMDAYFPEDTEAIIDIFTEGAFDGKLLEGYYCKCCMKGECFDLFDERRPFLQSARDQQWDKDGEEKVAALLFHDLPAGNNHVHFSHDMEEDQNLSPEQCSKALCAVNVFCTSGTQGPSSINGAPPIYVMVKGENLFETLVLNMIPCSAIGFSYNNPPPVWRDSMAVIPGEKAAKTSLLGGMTWQARRILLIPDDTGGRCTLSGRVCPVIVRQVFFQKGLNFEGYGSWWDPHVPYLTNKKGRSSIKPTEGKEAWRDLGAILLTKNRKENSRGVSFSAPITVTRYVDTADDIETSSFVSVRTYALATKQANYLSWMRDEISLSISIVEDEDKSNYVWDEIQKAELIAVQLRKFIGSKVSGKRNKDITEQVIMQFFFGVKELFFTILCPRVSKAEVKINWKDPLTELWNKGLWEGAKQSFETGVNRLGTNACALQRQAEARRLFYQRINTILKEGDK